MAVGVMRRGWILAILEAVLLGVTRGLAIEGT